MGQLQLSLKYTQSINQKTAKSLQSDGFTLQFIKLLKFKAQIALLRSSQLPARMGRARCGELSFC